MNKKGDINKWPIQVGQQEIQTKKKIKSSEPRNPYKLKEHTNHGLNPNVMASTIERTPRKCEDFAREIWWQ